MPDAGETRYNPKTKSFERWTPQGGWRPIGEPAEPTGGAVTRSRVRAAPKEQTEHRRRGGPSDQSPSEES